MKEVDIYSNIEDAVKMVVANKVDLVGGGRGGGWVWGRSQLQLWRWRWQAGAELQAVGRRMQQVHRS